MVDELGEIESPRDRNWFEQGAKIGYKAEKVAMLKTIRPPKRSTWTS